jgi:drug/metabolite transporter (DMT)-like permease
MFLAEMGCWLVVAGGAVVRGKLSAAQSYQVVGTEDPSEACAAVEMNQTGIAPSRGSRCGLRLGINHLLVVAAALDICGTTLMNTGLLLISPSIFQMTRGLVVMFVSELRVAFLGACLQRSQRLAILGVVLGVVIVGTASISPGQHARREEKGHGESTTSDSTHIIVGILIIAGAQVFTALQLVLQELILTHADLQPIQVMGREGAAGLVLTAMMMAVLYFAIGRTPAGQLGPFDVVESWQQVTSNQTVLVCSLLLMVSIRYEKYNSILRVCVSRLTRTSVFNVSGLSVTKHVSSTSRATIDACRMFFTWVVSLSIGWESFKWLQAVGFVLLLYSTLLFHDVVGLPRLYRVPTQRGMS